MDDILHLELKTPLRNAKGEDVAALDLREPTLGELERADNTNWVTRAKQLIHQQTQIPARELDKMAARDISKAAVFLANFTAADPGIGSGSSPS